MSEPAPLLPQQWSLETLTVQVSQVFDADSDTVFALLSNVRAMAGLGPEHQAVSGAKGPLGLGDSFVGHNRRGSRDWQVPCTVHLYDPPRAFGWIVGDLGEPTATWSYDLVSPGPSADTTVVRQRFTHGPGRSLLRSACERHPDRAGDFIAARAEELRRNMQTVLSAAADLLSAETGHDPQATGEHGAPRG